MGCIQGLRLLIGERPYPVQNEVDETPGIFNEPIMPSKNKNQRNNGKSSKESEEFSEENKRYQKKCNNVKNGKQNGFRGGLTTDAIPTPKHNGKQKKSFSSSLSSSTYEMNDMKDDRLSDQDELDKKYPIPTPEIQVDEPKDDNSEQDRRSYSSSSKYDDEGDGASEIDEDEGKSKRKKKKNKLMQMNPFKKSPRRSPDPERCIAYSASSSQQQYFISHSRNIHIGPTYEQKIIVNHVNNTPRPEGSGECSRSISVEETEAIRAVQECESPLTSEILEYVADEVGHRWRAMGRRLGYSNGKMDGFEINFHIQSERVYQLLLEWTQNKNEEATLATLSQTLWTIEAREVVIGLSKYVPRQPPN